MNEHIREIVGKKIKGVVVRDRETSNPPRQIFLIFDDGHYFEIYGSRLTWTKGLFQGGYDKIMQSEGDGTTVLAECDVRVSR